MAEPTYNGQKFRELVIYLAERSRIDPKFGDTKLHKLLYWIDFGAYRKLGRPVTGARYKRFPHGPVADPLWRERETLERVGAIRMEQRGYFGKRQKVTVPERPADLSVFDSEELAHIEEVVVRYQHHNAAEVRALSHFEASWKLADDKEVIPYETALITKGPLPESLRAQGNDLLHRYGW